jgi:hypothetical protein
VAASLPPHATDLASWRLVWPTLGRPGTSIAAANREGGKP